MEKLRSMILVLKDSSASVRSEANNNLDISLHTAQATDSQHNEIHHLVTATQEMSATAQEVSQIASSVSSSTDAIHQKVTTAQTRLSDAVEVVLELTDNINQVATAAEEQSSVSDEIAKNLTAIGDAAQTLSELSRQATTSSETVNQHMNIMEQNLNQLRT